MKKYLLIGLLLYCISTLAIEVKKSQLTIEIPNGWKEIPTTILKEASAERDQRAPNTNLAIPDYGFQLGDNWLNYPHVMVKVKSSGKFSRKEIDSLAKVNLSKMSKAINQDMKGVVDAVKVDSLYYDDNHKIIWLLVKFHAPDKGDIFFIQGMIPTNYGFIQVTCSSLSKDFEKYLPTFQGILTSIRVDSSISYK